MSKVITIDGVSRPYDCIIGEGAISLLNEKLSSCTKAKRVLLITDDNVDALYGDRVLSLIKSGGRECFKFVFPHGENHKNSKTVSDIIDFAMENRLSRSDCIVALGGGIVGDTAGFAASIILRGIDFLQIPTTFLSAIDSSVGGKTGVNCSYGKNLIGAFCQPRCVICDTDFFKTLTPQIFGDGVAEAIKYGVIFDKSLFERLNGDFTSYISEIVARCISLKGEIVKKDEFDTGERQLLNFGHTIGHAIERCSDFAISHGRAVGIGMVMVSRGAYKAGLTNEDYSSVITKALMTNNLPYCADFSAEELLSAMAMDKKRAGDSITLVIPEELGKCVLLKMPFTQLEEFIKLSL